MGLTRFLKHNRLIAALWGFAEATLFFIVPDVWLSYVALHKGFRGALWAICFCIAGAIIGGSLVYAASVWNPEATKSAIETLPAISPGMIADVRAALQHDPLWSMFVGSVSGVPYKIFASQAPPSNIDFINFALATIPARAPRFILVVTVTSIIARLLMSGTSTGRKTGVWAGCWLVFYSIYFTLMPN